MEGHVMQDNDGDYVPVQYREDAARINPRVTIWQYIWGQHMLQSGEVEGSPTNPEDLARVLSPLGGEQVSVAEVIEVSRQVRDYDRDRS